MLFLRTFAVISSVLGAVWAQGTSTVQSSTETGTASAPGATKTFSVGADGRTFTPRSHTANIGDIIEYRFYPLNHSVVKAAFGPEPCIPYEVTGAGRVGWWSGWMPTNTVTSNPPIFRIRINDTEPLFFYCSSPGACFDGMVGVVNPNSTFTFEAQLAYTQNATAALSPGEFFTEEKLDPSETSSGSRPTSTGAAKDEAHPHSLSTGAIVGIAIGGVAVLILAALLTYMCGRQKSFKDLLKHREPPKDVYQPASPGYSEAQYPNMLKSPAMTDSRFSAMTHQTYGAESYRSVSPPIEGRNAIASVMMNGSKNGYPSPGQGSVNWGSPSPKYEEMHEMDHGDASVKGIRPSSSAPPLHEVHELAAPQANTLSPNLTPVSRNFSFSNSEAGYAGGMRDSAVEPRR